MDAEPIYLDHAATTPMREEVRAAMDPYLHEVFGNPSSRHRWGREASAALENARAEAAESLGVRASEVCFVRGGTEGDNLAALGICRALKQRGPRATLVVSAIEHHAVLEAAVCAEQDGLARVVTLDVARDGTMDLDHAREVLMEGPSVVSCMWVNNETGIILPIPELTELALEAGAIMHSDAVQAVGKIPVDLAEVPLHVLTVSGHKMYGPKGAGLLFVRTGTPIAPLLHGGGQERALRPGTEDVAGAVGLSTALRLAIEDQEAEAVRLGGLRDELEARLVGQLDGIRINGGEARRAPHVSNIGFASVNGAMLLISLDLEGVAASGASACSSGSDKGSHVMAALYGTEDEMAQVRFSLGRATRKEDIERAVEVTSAVVRRLRGAA
jgi:cysteine desulfurase